MMLCQLLAPSLTELRTLAACREVLSYAFDQCINEARLACQKGYEMGVRKEWEAAGKKGDRPSALKEAAQEGKVATEAEAVDLHAITGHMREEIAGFLLDELEGLERRTGSEALTVWEAFANVCNKQLKTEPETLVKAWFEPILHEIEELENLPDPPEVDAKELQKYEEAFKGVWKDMTRSR